LDNKVFNSLEVLKKVIKILSGLKVSLPGFHIAASRIRRTNDTNNQTWLYIPCVWLV